MIVNLLNSTVCFKKAVDTDGPISKHIEIHYSLNNLIVNFMTIIIGIRLIFDQQTWVFFSQILLVLESNYCWKRNLCLIYPVIKVTGDNTCLLRKMFINSLIFGQITFDCQGIVTLLLRC